MALEGKACCDSAMELMTTIRRNGESDRLVFLGHGLTMPVMPVPQPLFSCSWVNLAGVFRLESMLPASDWMCRESSEKWWQSRQKH